MTTPSTVAPSWTSPVGNISHEGLEEGYNILKQIEQELRLGRQENLVGLTNQYFTKIPHSFGRERPPLIDNEQLLNKEKQRMEELLWPPRRDWIWQFDSRHGWFDFVPASSDQIEKFFQQYQETGVPQTMDVTSGHWNYLINFENMTQQNTQHRNYRIRNIRRVPIGESNPPSSS